MRTDRQEEEIGAHRSAHRSVGGTHLVNGCKPLPRVLSVWMVHHTHAHWADDTGAARDGGVLLCIP